MSLGVSTPEVEAPNFELLNCKHFVFVTGFVKFPVLTEYYPVARTHEFEPLVITCVVRKKRLRLFAFHAKRMLIRMMMHYILSNAGKMQ